MTSDAVAQGSSSAATAATDGHQDVGNQNEAIPEPQLDATGVDVSDIEERPAPAGGDDGADA